METQGVFIPDDLKKILKVTKYDNINIANFTSEDRDKIVTFMRKTLHTIIPTEMREDYYDIFQYNPEKFVLVPGQELSLKAIIRTAKLIINKPASDKAKGHNKRHHENPQQNNRKEPEIELVDKQKKLEDAIKTFLTGFPDKSYSASTTVFSDGNGSYCATVDCPVKNCSKKTKVSMNATRWNTSNFFSHVRTHVKPEEPKPKNPLKNYLIKTHVESNEGSQAPRKRCKIGPSNDSEANDSEAEDNDLGEIETVSIEGSENGEDDNNNSKKANPVF